MPVLTHFHSYLGAARDIVNKDYLDAAGSILAIEARHTSYIRASLNQSPFPNPFDTPLKYVCSLFFWDSVRRC